MHDEDHHMGKDLEELGVETHDSHIDVSIMSYMEEKPLVMPMFSLSLNPA